ncbi:MAG: hypothetical protein WB493_01485 [Anaeromyxobacteraceae bacterium]
MSDDRRERGPAEKPDAREAAETARRPYQAPRIVKRRAVSRATLFSGSGPDSGGVISTSG